MPELDYRAIRRTAQAELKRQKTIARRVFFVLSLLIYLLFLGIGWGFIGEISEQLGQLTPSAQSSLVAAMVMLTVGGGLAVMFQMLTALLETEAGEASMRAKIMSRMVAEEMIRLGEEEEGLDEKAKRMMISDEGELEEIIDEVEQDSRYQSKK